MNKKALKSTIIELKEHDLSFQDISDILAKEYNIHMSRQAVCGMYNRATSDEVIKKNKEIILTTEDVINYSLLGLDSASIKEILSNMGYEITISDIKHILDDNAEYLKAVEAEQVNKVVKGVKNGNDADEIRNRITYKSVVVTDSRFKKLIKLAAEYMIYEQGKRVLTSIYNTTDDKALVKNIIADHNMNITMKDIEGTKQSADYDIVICKSASTIVRPKSITTQIVS